MIHGRHPQAKLGCPTPTLLLAFSVSTQRSTTAIEKELIEKTVIINGDNPSL
jgi:hypothetical protein